MKDIKEQIINLVGVVIFSIGLVMVSAAPSPLSLIILAPGLLIITANMVRLKK